jgi:membrane associated rhomboid family serine protease
MTNFRSGIYQRVPPVILNLLIINVLVFLGQQAFGPETEYHILNSFALHDLHSPLFKPYQLVTYLFLHGGWDHIIFNMFALWIFGSILENYWGGKRFLAFYLVCGIGAGICNMAVVYYENAHLIQQFTSSSPDTQQFQYESIAVIINTPTLGASGAIFGCLAAFGYLFPNTEMIMIPIPIPIKAKWLVLGYAALELFSGVRATAGDNVAHWAHLGGGLVGLLLVIYWNRNNRRNFY